MADILAEITELETRIQELIERSGRTGSARTWERGLIEAIIGILDDYDLDYLKSADLEGLISEAIVDTNSQFSVDMIKYISTTVSEMVKLTADFYIARGEEPGDLLRAVQRSVTGRKLSGVLQEGMKNIKNKLLKNTVTIMEKAIAAGTIDRDVLRDEIAVNAGASRTHADTQTMAYISAYNQLARNEMAVKAELSVWYYYGPEGPHTRLFCHHCIGKSFEYADLIQLKNGQVEPVSVHCGGYRCIHSILPGKPDWDPVFKPFKGKLTTLPDGNNQIVVFI